MGKLGAHPRTQDCLRPLFGTPLTWAAVPLGLYGKKKKKTPAAADQVHLTPDGGGEREREKKRNNNSNSPSLIPFGKSPGCQVHYIMPAQADTCAVLELDGVLAAAQAWNVGSAAPGPNVKGKRNEFGAGGRRLGLAGMGKWWGLDLGEEAPEWLPSTLGMRKIKAAVSRFQSPLRERPTELAAPGWGGLPGASPQPHYGLARHQQPCSGASRSPHSRPAPATWVLLTATLEVPTAWPDRMPLSLKTDSTFINRPSLKQPKRSSVPQCGHIRYLLL